MKPTMRLCLGLLTCLCLVAAPVIAEDLSITAANVVPASPYQFVDGVAGEAITAGQTVYLKITDGRYWLADADASALTATLAGIALNGASAGQPVRVQTGGTLNPGASLTVGEIYVLSDTPGGIMPEGDLEQGDRVSIVGIATASNVLLLAIKNSGAAVP